MTTFVLVSLRTENSGFTKTSVRALWNVFSNANLKAI